MFNAHKCDGKCAAAQNGHDSYGGPACAARANRQSPCERAESGSCEQATRNIECLRLCIALSVRDKKQRKHNGGDRERNVQQKNRAPTERIDEPAANDRPNSAGHRPHCCPYADGAPTPLSAKSFTQNGKAVRQKNGGANSFP